LRPLPAAGRCAITAGMSDRTIILGMGNPILCDDAVGIRLARDFSAQVQHRVDVVEECSVGGLNILDLVTGYDRLIVFDSIKTVGGLPGAWYSMTGETFKETMNLANVHDANFTTALELGRRLGSHIPSPENIHIFAIEVVDNATFSESMTPELESAYPEYSCEIIQQALRLLQD
jgi:hydrogenase maturation protease